MASKCQNCGTVIRLKGQEPMCPNCGKNPYYCWSCKEEIKGSEQICPACGFFVCNKCGSCGRECILDKQNYTITDVRNIIEKIKRLDRKTCPEGVPISYAHYELRNAALKIKGQLVKNESDSEAFRRRLEELKNFLPGKKWTISQIRELGSKGKEWREISNMGICLGWVKKTVIIKDDEEFDFFERVEGEPCPYRNWDKLLTKVCPRCKKEYTEDDKEWKTGFCTCFYEKGEKKNLCPELKQRKSNITFCQLSRENFIRKEVDHGKGEQSQTIS